MRIENYTLSEAQAEDIPGFYYLGNEHSTNGSGLTFKSRNEERPNPMITYDVDGYKGAQCILTLHPHISDIDRVDIIGEEKDMPAIKGLVESVLGISLGNPRLRRS